MKAPLPYFGGKAMVARLVWDLLGNPANYVEPFAGSLAVLLARPNPHRWWEKIESVNDADALLANYWRATQADPDAVARYADWIISECDLHARHAWLVGQRPSITARLEGDPDWFDAKAAGWWLWGICSWIGSGWCSGNGPWVVQDGELVNGNAGRGINRQLPHLGDAGRGINRQLPHLGNAGRGLCAAWTAHLIATMQALSDRLRRVRVCCGDWTRVLGETPTITLGTTGIFLDPPYNLAERDTHMYAVDGDIAGTVREWALAHGDDPRYRIVLAGYDTEHVMPSTWQAIPWKAHGGYGVQSDGRGRANASREMLWASPHCQHRAPDLFQYAEQQSTNGVLR